LGYDERIREKSCYRKGIMGMRKLRKYRFKFRNFLRTREHDIEAFSLTSAITRLLLLYPIADVLSVKEVTDEP
jgi:hypothetical protein